MSSTATTDSPPPSLLTSAEPINFTNIINNRFWPDGKVNRKLLIDIPDGFMEAIDRVTVFAKSKLGKEGDDRIDLVIVDGTLTMTGQGGGGVVKETMDTDHPNVKVSLTPSLVKQFLKYSDRMIITTGGMGLFGPKRFSRYIANRG